MKSKAKQITEIKKSVLLSEGKEISVTAVLSPSMLTEEVIQSLKALLTPEEESLFQLVLCLQQN